MIQISPSRSVTTIFIIAVSCVIAVKGVPNTAEIYRSCYGSVNLGGDYQWCVNDVIADLTKNTGTSGNRLYLGKTKRDSRCAGLAACDNNIGAVDCKACLQVADIELLTHCGNAEIARIQLHDCYLRFHNATIDDE